MVIKNQSETTFPENALYNNELQRFYDVTRFKLDDVSLRPEIQELSGAQ
jgi:hypothetical protein